MAPGNLDKATESLEFVVKSAECNSPLDDSRSRSLTALKIVQSMAIAAQWKSQLRGGPHIGAGWALSLKIDGSGSICDCQSGG